MYVNFQNSSECGSMRNYVGTMHNMCSNEGLHVTGILVIIMENAESEIEGDLEECTYGGNNAMQKTTFSTMSYYLCISTTRITFHSAGRKVML